MTLNAKIGVLWISGDFGLRDTVQEQFAPKPIEIDMDKLHMKFAALIVDFNSPSLDFLDSRKLVHESIKQRYLRKSLYFIVVVQ